MRATLPENRAVMTLITLNRQRRTPKRTRSVRKGMRRGASHDSCGYRSLRSSVGIQVSTLCVARGRGASGLVRHAPFAPWRASWRT
ncbi:hypothetical protein PsdCFBP2356_17450 [Pseudomonas syringae pv. dysoxyli]|nr:hypothetical protein [Pseudomonas syringae pv. dysoxyli]TRN88315.1 hypothetical protein DT385_04095 [Pseudomonas syringae]